jgi:hypothetical protein
LNPSKWLKAKPGIENPFNRFSVHGSEFFAISRSPRKKVIKICIRSKAFFQLLRQQKGTFIN